MSFICEHRTGSCESGCRMNPEPLYHIQDELVWGLSYRHYKEKENAQPIPPVKSPIDIPFKICRAELMRKRKKGSKKQRSELSLPESEDGGKDKLSLLDRSVMSQKKYMDYLSKPNPKFEEPPPKKYKRRCELEPCPPRFVQLAVPNKRRVFANWKDYQHFLPTEMLLRYEQILHTDQNLEPREARYYYKRLDREKKKKLRAKKREKKRKQLEKQRGDTQWLREQINMTTKVMVDYIKDEPLFALNYKQLMLSDAILDRLDKISVMKKPKRKTRNQFKKTSIEISDKFAVWIDTLTRFVDVQAVDSEEDIPALTISSLSEEGEEESEGESELESEEDRGLTGEDIWGEDGLLEDAMNIIGSEQLATDIFKPGEAEGEDDLNDFIGSLDEDTLEKLIQILSNCSDEFLDGFVDENQLPDIKYSDILKKLKDLKAGILEGPPKHFLEDIMYEWAMKNDPDRVDDKISKKIHEVAPLLFELLGKGFGDGGIGEGEGEGEEGEGKGASVGGEEGEGEGEEGEGGEGGPSAPPEEIEGQEGEGEEHEIETTDMAGEGEGEEGAEEGPEGSAKLPGEDELSDIPTAEQFGEEEGVASGFDFTDLTDESALATEGIEGEEGLPSELPLDKELGKEEVGEEGELLPGEELGVKRPEEAELELLEGEGYIIKGHKPSVTLAHSPDMVCCLSLKTWAVWLLEITHNAHGWTKWLSAVIHQIKEFAATVRGNVKLPNGETKVLHKAEWRKFAKETEEMSVAWRQYSAHVKELSDSIMDNFRGKKVACCPKCLQDHLIRNVVVAHDTLQALTEAISCASYWQRCLDELVDRTVKLTGYGEEPVSKEEEAASSESTAGDADLEDISIHDSSSSGDGVYEIEELEQEPRQ